MKKISFLIFIIGLIGFNSCKKDVITDDPNARLQFSIDTLKFDTVFTSLGSTTKRFMVYNRNTENVVISSIKIKGGNLSNFRINVNGQPGDATDIEIKGQDSMFVFAEVTVDPNTQNNPFVIFDEVEFKTNGNTQSVILSAWGQNAYYYKPNLFINGLPPISHITDYPDYFPIGGPVIDLPNDKPHVIFGFLMIDSAITLNIPAGTQLHFYDQSGMWAYRGSTLNVNGELGNEVVFQGTRLESGFDDIPGQWDRIFLNEGPNDHQINNAIIKNAFIGIQAEEFYLDGVPELATNSVKLYNTVIKNSGGLGLLVRNHNIIADNTLITNSGNVLVALQGAGTHHFLHSTIANYSSGSRSDESLLLSNYFYLPTTDGSRLEVAGDFSAKFENSIIYGTIEEEILTDSTTASGFDYLFDHCVLKTLKDTLDPGLNGKFNHIIQNPSKPNSSVNYDPLFTDPYNNEFLLNDSSRAIDEGSFILMDTLVLDLKGESRDLTPDLGSYEK